ncbi:MAG: Mov34/MPN/PAD-1 family protein [Roseiflexaceae bacterium]
MRLCDGLSAALHQWGRQGYPDEVVALLLGTINDTDEITITDFIPVANQATDTTRHFELDPHGWLIADAQAQALGREIVGIVHTHPDGIALPSSTDSASAEFLGCRFAYLIVSVTAAGTVTMQAWRWNGHQFMSQRLLCR